MLTVYTCSIIIISVEFFLLSNNLQISKLMEEYIYMYVNMRINYVKDYCDFEADPEVSRFLTEDLVGDDGDWIRKTVNLNMF